MGRNPQAPEMVSTALRETSHQLTLMGLVVGAFLALFLCKFDNCMWILGMISFRPQLPLMAALCIMVILVWNKSPGMFSHAIKESRSCIIPFAMIAWLSLIGAALPDADLGDGGIELIKSTIDFLLFLLAIPLAIVFVSNANWRFACGLALVASVGSILVDTVNPGTFSMLEYRAAGFGVNPNMGAAQSGLLLIGVLDWKQPRLTPISCLWVALAFAGVFMTLSRSGILMLGISCSMYLFLCVKRDGMKVIVLLTGLVLCGGSYALTVADVAKNSTTLLDGSNSRVKMFTGEFDAMDSADDSRVELVGDYLDLIFKHPILGWGTGFNSGADLGSHNMFLALWVDNGIFGMLAYLMVIWSLFRIGRHHHSWECVAIAINFFVQSFFSHNLLEDKTLVLLMAIAVGRAVLDTPTLKPIAKNGVGGSRKMPYSPAKQLVGTG